MTASTGASLTFVEKQVFLHFCNLSFDSAYSVASHHLVICSKKYHCLILYDLDTKARDKVFGERRLITSILSYGNRHMSDD